ncbi:MBL fold metallo-hydrolase [Thioclava sp.]|uniref:MBL fold metallo-hydrolase n=1 Tax=Thioclava sp. TaxID=1933450 RepID=UPI0032424EAA
MTEYHHLTRHSPTTGRGSPDVWGIYEEASGSIQYVVACPETKAAVVIDTVLNFDPAAARTSTESAELTLALIQENGLVLNRILDTHPHADHLMASHWLKQRTGKPNAIGEKIQNIAKLWREYYNEPEAFQPERYFDLLFANGDTFEVGSLSFRVILSPGHTLGSITYIVGDAVFAHDTLMYPDVGSSRADFPGGSAAQLWESIQEILSFPRETRIFIGHDYGTDERPEPMWEATVDEHLKFNKHVKEGVTRADFIAAREKRDAVLSLPDRMLYALQVNLRGGALPAPEADGNSYLKIPINKF